MTTSSRTNGQFETLLTELHQLCNEDCLCPPKLDGPWASPDSVYRTKHLENCERAVFLRKIFDPLSERDEARRLLEASSHALRSYQYGNVATDLAKDLADAIDRFLKTGAPETLVGKGMRVEPSAERKA